MQIEIIRGEQVPMFLQKGAQFIDLRDKEDYDRKHIKNAISMPYDTFEDNYKKLNKTKTYVLYCERGGSSMLGARKMQQAGYHVYSLSGGFMALDNEKMIDSRWL